MRGFTITTKRSKKDKQTPATVRKLATILVTQGEAADVACLRRPFADAKKKLQHPTKFTRSLVEHYAV